MKARQFKKWEEIRKKGKKKFILHHGVIGWGLPCGVLFPFVSSFLENSSVRFDQSFFSLLAASLVLFPLVGILFGLWIWHGLEQAYKKNINE
jgi:hypothetical protein